MYVIFHVEVTVEKKSICALRQEQNQTNMKMLLLSRIDFLFRYKTEFILCTY